jgi:hypothetical protein
MDHKVINSILWTLRTGAPWKYLRRAPSYEAYLSRYQIRKLLNRR